VNNFKERGARGPEAGEAVSGFAMLSNRFITNAVLAHLRADAVKVYLALLLAARSKRLICWPTLETLARWSGVPESKVSEETEYLAQHRLIVKNWIQIGGKPRMSYRIVSPETDMFPDLRGSCTVCMNTDHRGSCVLRDPKTGRLLGRRPRPGSTDHREPGIPDHRDSHMITDHRGTKQTEADEKIGSRRGGGPGEPDDGLRSAPPREAASLRGPSLEAEPDGGPGEPDISGFKAAWEGKGRTAAETDPETSPATPIEVHAARFRQRGLDERTALHQAQALVGDPTHRKGCPVCRGLEEIRSVQAELSGEATPPVPVVARPPEDGASRTSPPIETPRPPVPVTSSGVHADVSADGRCQGTTRDRSECALRALPGSPFCRRHQRQQQEAACVSVG
jgi:hypothetical protein